jgi:Flp pilus assembly protein TadG
MRNRWREIAITGRDLARRFRRDQSGNYLILTGMLMPAVVGFVGLGTDYGLLSYMQRAMQGAADSAALSAAMAYITNGSNSVITQANSITSSYGFTNGVGSVAVTVNQPPQSGNYTTQPDAVEVLVTQPQKPLFSALFLSNQITVKARAVAKSTNAATGCVLSLDATASDAIWDQGNASVNLIGCSLYVNSDDSDKALAVQGSSTMSALSVNVVGGITGQNKITSSNIVTGAWPMGDPYGSVTQPQPAGPTFTNTQISNSVPPLNPGTYVGGIKLTGQANVTLNAGTYFLECPCSSGSGLDVAGGTTLNGSGVTLVFTSSNGSSYAAATINGNANVNLSAPPAGATSGVPGIVMFGDRNMPLSTTFTLNGGSTQKFAGAIYVSKGKIKFAGGANESGACTQIIADTITFIGNSNVAISCSGKGTRPLGGGSVSLVE